MSHTKGQWVARDSAIGVVSDADDQSFGMMLAVAYVEQYDRPEEWVDNSRRIVDCVNACDGMENPADEIAKLRGERDAAIGELSRLADAFRFFIEDGERPSEFILAEWEFKAQKACS